MCLISSGGTLGSIISPFIASIGMSPLIPMGIFSLIGTFIVLPMRETFHMKLEDEIEEEIQPY